MKVLYDQFPLRSRVFAAGIVTLDELTEMTVTTARNSSRLVTAVRAVITDDKIMIAADSDKGPMLLFRETYDPSTLTIVKNPMKNVWLMTVSGKAIVLEKDANCGCGSKLRGWNPYKTINSVKDPQE